MPPLGKYTFRILDGASDGICCSYGRGGWGLGIEGRTLHVGNPSFGSSDMYQFELPIVPAPPPLPPPPSPPPAPPLTPYERFRLSVNVKPDRCVCCIHTHMHSAAHAYIQSTGVYAEGSNQRGVTWCGVAAAL